MLERTSARGEPAGAVIAAPGMRSLVEVSPRFTGKALVAATAPVMAGPTRDLRHRAYAIEQRSPAVAQSNGGLLEIVIRSFAVPHDERAVVIHGDDDDQTRIDGFVAHGDEAIDDEVAQLHQPVPQLKATALVHRL